MAANEPDRDQLYEEVSKIIDTEGAHNISCRILRQRLEATFKCDLSARRELIDELIEKKVIEPKTHKTIRDYEKLKAEGLVSKGKKKRNKKTSSQTPAKKKTREEGAGRVKKEKNEGPKKPTTAYFAFTNAIRGEIKEANPGIGITDIAKKIGEKWKELSDEEKQKYSDLAAADKERYEKECADVVAAGGSIGKKASKKAAKKEKASGPKKPLSAYFVFTSQKRKELLAEDPSLKITDLAKKMGEIWGTLSEADRAPFQKIADEDRERYERECKEQGISRPSVGKKRTRAEAKDISSDSGSSSDSDSGSSSSGSDSSSDDSSSSSSSSDSD